MLFLGNISWGLGSALKVQESLSSGDHHDLQTAKEAVVHGFLGSEVKTMGVLSAQGMDSCLSNILLDVSWGFNPANPSRRRHCINLVPDPQDRQES